MQDLMKDLDMKPEKDSQEPDDSSECISCISSEEAHPQ